MKSVQSERRERKRPRGRKTQSAYETPSLHTTLYPRFILYRGVKIIQIIILKKKVKIDGISNQHPHLLFSIYQINLSRDATDTHELSHSLIDITERKPNYDQNRNFQSIQISSAARPQLSSSQSASRARSPGESKIQLRLSYSRGQRTRSNVTLDGAPIHD